MNNIQKRLKIYRGSFASTASKTVLLIVSIFLWQASTVSAETVRIPVEKLLGQKVVSLRCNSSGFSIFFPIAERWRVNKASLSFRVVNSPTLISKGSMLSVRVNGKPVWSRVLSPEKPEQYAYFEIPPKLIGHKYNEIDFHVAQHFTLTCEHPCDPNLWTDIDFSNSFIEVDYDLLPVPLVLSKVHNFLFDDKSSGKGKINIVIPGKLEDASDTILTAATVLASGIGKMFNYVPVNFSVSDKIKYGADNIVLGLNDDLRELLPEKVLPKIVGPSIKIARLPLENADEINSDLIAAQLAEYDVKEQLKRKIYKSDVLEAIDKWLESWTNEEIKIYSSFYSPKFISENGDKKKRYIQKIKNVFNQIGIPRITISEITVISEGDTAQAVFKQDYRSANLVGKKWRKTHNVGWKKLVWVREGDKFKIVSEHWSEDKLIAAFPKPDDGTITSDEKLDDLVQDYDPIHALIILSGKTDEEIKLSTEAFVSLTFPYTGVSEMEVLEFQVKDIKTYSGKGIIESGKLTKFRNLGFNTYTFYGLLPAARNLNFRLPPDFDIKPNQYAKLSLNFAYSGGLRVGSGLNILVNGVFANKVSFDNSSGISLEDYEITIPTYLFKPGKNLLSFSPVMIPDTEGCELILPESLFVTIHDNSTLYFPHMPHFVKMPNINLFMLNGYPFTVWPDAAGTLIVLSDKNQPALEAAMNTVGMVSQNNGFPLFSIDVRKNMPDKWDGNVMIFGTSSSLVDDISTSSVLSIKKKKTQISYPFSKNPKGISLAQIQQISGIGLNRGAILEFKSPYGNNKTAIVFSAETKKDLAKLGVAVTDAGVQTDSRKDFVIVDFRSRDYKVSSLAVEKSYYVGADSMWDKAVLYFYLHPYAAYIIGGILLIMFVTSAMLMYRNILIRKATEEDPEVDGSEMGIFSILKKTFLFLFIARKAPQKNDNEQ